MKPLKLAYSCGLPFKGFGSITLFGFLVRRNEKKETSVSDITGNHESIHHQQAQDFHLWYFGYVIFYLLYFIEGLIKCLLAPFGYRAYYSVSFEQEAYRNQTNMNYLKERKPFAGMKYLFKMIKK